MLSIAVEGKTDRLIIEGLLSAAGIFDPTFLVLKRRIVMSQPKSAELLALVGRRPTLLVFDQDNVSVGDAVAINDKDSETIFCPAIPSVEAWLFADSATLFRVLGERADGLVGRMPLPEQIPYPKFLRHALLRDVGKTRELLSGVDIITAGSRSPSLKYFVQSARRLSGLPELEFEAPSATHGQLDRSVLRNLVSEVYPSSAPLFRSASGDVLSAEQMMQELLNGSEVGREYGSDILRVARDLLTRQALKKTQKSRDQS